MKLKPFLWVGLILGSAAVILLGAFLRKQQPSPTTAETPPASVTAALSQAFQLAERREDRFSLRSTFTNAEQEVVQLETIADLEAESARTLIEEGIMAVEALYANALSAYPEHLSREIATPEQFRPAFHKKERNGTAYNYFLLYANERFAYGAASKEMLKLRSLLGWFYCEQKRELYKVRVFAPVKVPFRKLEDLFLGLPCS